MLISREIVAKSIVIDGRDAGRRATTYDATVGAIIQRGKEIRDESFLLPPRGIVWVVSAEIFDVPDDITGLATLRTTWTHDGVLALNVGVVDPLWQGPLAAAIVNFGNGEFEVKKGDPFLRLMFHRHERTQATPVVKTMSLYKKEISQKSKMYSATFLNMESLVPEVAHQVLSMPRWVSFLTIVGLVVAAVAIFAPIAWSVFSDHAASGAQIKLLDDQIGELSGRSANSADLQALEDRVRALETNAQR